MFVDVSLMDPDLFCLFCEMVSRDTLVLMILFCTREIFLLSFPFALDLLFSLLNPNQNSIRGHPYVTWSNLQEICHIYFLPQDIDLCLSIMKKWKYAMKK